MLTIKTHTNTDLWTPLHQFMEMAHAFHDWTIDLSGIVRVGAGLDLTSEGSLQSPLCVCLWIETRFPEIFCVPASRVLHAVCIFASFKIIFECLCYVKQRFSFLLDRGSIYMVIILRLNVQGPKSCCLILLKCNKMVMCHLQVFPKVS